MVDDDRQLAIARVQLGQPAQVARADKRVQPQPMLHLAGLTKPLLLDAANVAALTRIAASPLQRDWVGREVTLAVVPEGSQLVIRLFAPDDPALGALRRKSRAAARARTTARWLRRLLRYALILLFLLALASAALYVYQNWAMLTELVTTLVNGLLSP